jgi:hypothetical protein
MWWCHDFGKRLEIAIEEETRNRSAYAIKRKNVVVQFNLGPEEILRDDRNRFFFCNNNVRVSLLSPDFSVSFDDIAESSSSS